MSDIPGFYANLPINSYGTTFGVFNGLQTHFRPCLFLKPNCSAERLGKAENSCCRRLTLMRKAQRFARALLADGIEPNPRDCNVHEDLRRAAGTGSLGNFTLVDKPSLESCPFGYNPRIKFSTYPSAADPIEDENPFNARSFKRSYSDAGLALSFNLDQHDFERDGTLDEVRYPPVMEQSYGAIFGVQNKNMLNQPKNDIKLAVGSPFDLPSLRYESFQLMPGYEYHFRVSALSVVADKGLERLTESERGCRFAHENAQMVTYENYTQKKCIFECQLKHAFRKCGCIPWNYPDISSGKGDICHWNSLACHEKAMLNVSFEIFVTKNNNIRELAL